MRSNISYDIPLSIFFYMLWLFPFFQVCEISKYTTILKKTIIGGVQNRACQANMSFLRDPSVAWLERRMMKEHNFISEIMWSLFFLSGVCVYCGSELFDLYVYKTLNIKKLAPLYSLKLPHVVYLLAFDIPIYVVSVRGPPAWSSGPSNKCNQTSSSGYKFRLHV